ncbi:MAG: acyltransferase [Bacteroidales bacterium]|nr:acyltransferase [Bacteroidales bacterium]
MSIKTKLKSRLSWLRVLRRYQIHIKLHYLYPLQHTRYGYIAPTAQIETPVFLTNQANVYLEDRASIKSGFKLVNTSGKLIIKRDARIAINCTVVTGNHVRISGIPLGVGNVYHIGDIERDIIIGEECWIGVNVTLLSGAKVGRGAIIGGCSMVNKEIPPYAVAVGSPAKVIASTFSIDQIIEHEKTIYAPEERYSRAELEEIFNTHFDGKKSIGIDPTPEMKEQVASIASSLGIKLYQ